MLNKKLTRKNTGKKQWKSKKRKRVLRGGVRKEAEKEIAEEPLDGKKVCSS